jgi:hypothetical protein
VAVRTPRIIDSYVAPRARESGTLNYGHAPQSLGHAPQVS